MLTQQSHVASVFLRVPLGGPARAAASLSPGLTLAAAGLWLSSVTGSAETLMRLFALASAACKGKKGHVVLTTAPVSLQTSQVQVSDMLGDHWLSLLYMLAIDSHHTGCSCAAGTGGIGLAGVVAVAWCNAAK